MKNLLLGIVLSVTFMTNGALANTSYQCQDAYNKKLEKIEKNRLVRTIGAASIGLGLIVGGVAVPMIIWGGSVGGGAVLTAFITAPTAQGIINIFDREEGLILAKKFSELSQRDREELKQETYISFIDRKLAQANSNTPVVTTREQIVEAYPYDEFKMVSIVDSTLAKINKKRARKSLPEFSYEEFQAEIALILDTDKFCEKRPQTMRKVIRILKRELM